MGSRDSKSLHSKKNALSMDLTKIIMASKKSIGKKIAVIINKPFLFTLGFVGEGGEAGKGTGWGVDQTGGRTSRVFPEKLVLKLLKR
jgi:hypothetical protein